MVDGLTLRRQTVHFYIDCFFLEPMKHSGTDTHRPLPELVKDYVELNKLTLSRNGQTHQSLENSLPSPGSLRCARAMIITHPKCDTIRTTLSWRRAPRTMSKRWQNIQRAPQSASSPEPTVSPRTCSEVIAHVTENQSARAPGTANDFFCKLCVCAAWCRPRVLWVDS